MAVSLVLLRHLRPHQSRLPIYHPCTKKRSLSFPGFDYRVQHCMRQCLLCPNRRVLRVRADLCFLPPSSSLHVVLIPHRLGPDYQLSVITFWKYLGVVLCVSVLAPLVSIIGQRAVLGLSGYVINNIGFVFAAVHLYRLSVVIFKDQEAAVRASILFCFNSASIFYSSIYSETLFALFSVGGLYHLISGKDVIAVLWFALSGFSRFNGVLNAGYFCFQTMHQAYDAVFLRKRPFLVLQAVVGGALHCICIFVPFIAFQAYGYNNLCLGYVPSDMRPWCNARVPLLYNYIQSHFWYLPNFLLASPILSLALCSIVHYAKSNPENLFSLGFRAPLEDKDSAAVLFSLAEYSSRTKQGYLSVAVLPCILHLGFMSFSVEEFVPFSGKKSQFAPCCHFFNLHLIVIFR
ncbi:unnamed protein product [Malus baccata var. baccata]